MARGGRGGNRGGGRGKGAGFAQSAGIDKGFGSARGGGQTFPNGGGSKRKKAGKTTVRGVAKTVYSAGGDNTLTHLGSGVPAGKNIANPRGTTSRGKGLYDRIRPTVVKRQGPKG